MERGLIQIYFLTRKYSTLHTYKNIRPKNKTYLRKYSLSSSRCSRRRLENTPCSPLFL